MLNKQQYVYNFNTHETMSWDYKVQLVLSDTPFKM